MKRDSSCLFVTVVVLSSIVILAAVALDSIAASKWMDGVYEGKSFKFPGVFKVNLEISGGSITAITVVKHLALKKYTDMLEPLIQRIITFQSTEVDGVTGATISSKSLKKAVDNALRKATIE